MVLFRSGRSRSPGSFLTFWSSVLFWVLVDLMSEYKRAVSIVHWKKRFVSKQHNEYMDSTLDWFWIAHAHSWGDQPITRYLDMILSKRKLSYHQGSIDPNRTAPHVQSDWFESGSLEYWLKGWSERSYIPPGSLFQFTKSKTLLIPAQYTEAMILFELPGCVLTCYP
jgi:hypothetical protein